MIELIKKYLLWFLILVYFCGTIGFAIKPDFFRPFTPVTLLLTAFVFLIHQPLKNKSYLFAFCIVALIGFTAEVIGVKTGWIFGDYEYGHVIGYKLMNVPILISLNWALLIATGVLLCTYLSKKRIASSLLAATLITGIDFLMEQVCSTMDFWYFKEGIAGIQNYLAWFVISFLCSFFFFKTLSKGNKRVAIVIISLQIFFFGITYLIKLL